MKFCGLSWDIKCLEFYKRKELISKTSSNRQIRKAIYKHSEKKYLPYKKFLKKSISKEDIKLSVTVNKINKAVS